MQRLKQLRNETLSPLGLTSINGFQVLAIASASFYRVKSTISITKPFLAKKPA